ncbi:MAG: hypothetical protein PHW93_04855 [Candidatus Methanomethylophilaceae archaeon]|nr:hypothetical protein [Candidatus Methanomethylophilaceae archaeon]
MITETVFFNGVFYISLILAIFSVPTVVSTLMISHKQMYRYRLLRSIEEKDRRILPPNMLGEWMSVQSAVGYGNIIMMEVDRLNSLKPAILQATLSAALLAILYFFPGYTEGIFLWMGLIFSVIAVTVVAGELTIRRYAKEYLSMALEVEREDKEDLGIIYS